MLLYQSLQLGQLFAGLSLLLIHLHLRQRDLLAAAFQRLHAVEHVYHLVVVVLHGIELQHDV